MTDPKTQSFLYPKIEEVKTWTFEQCSMNMGVILSKRWNTQTEHYIFVLQLLIAEIYWN